MQWSLTRKVSKHIDLGILDWYRMICRYVKIITPKILKEFKKLRQKQPQSQIKNNDNINNIIYILIEAYWNKFKTFFIPSYAKYKIKKVNKIYFYNIFIYI